MGMLGWLRWPVRVLGGLLVLVALVAAERFFTLRGSLPDYEGTLTVRGLAAPARIVRDSRAIPHITASNLADGAFALGLAHAQDRLWQMTILRRAGQGRLAELFGSPALDVDRTLRALDLDGLARSSLEALAPDVQAVLRAYAQGVNSRIRDRDRPLPPEFFLLQAPAERWEPHHSLIMMSMLGLGLSGNAFSELARLDLADRLTHDQIADLMAPAPGLPEGVDLAPFMPSQADDPDTPRTQAGLPFGRAFGASNNWVTDGSRTATGGPLLANDPHLGLMMPGLWYLAHLTIDGRSMAGATLPGIPAILLGHTDDIAWGMTNTGTDVQDLVLERLDPENADAYLTPSGSRAFTAREETFKVRLGQTVTETLRTTRHGPVIPLLQDQAPIGHVWSVLWTALTPQNRTFEVSVRILGARSLTAVRTLMADYVSPTQNFVFADRSGEIGFVAAGAVPLRHPDVPGGGLVPVAGWRHETVWTGLMDPADWPQIWSPEDGVLVTANNDIRPDGYDGFITAEWTLPYRAERIRSLIEAGGPHTLDSFAGIVGDHWSGLRPRLLARMLDATPGREDLNTALDALRAWDGEMGLDRSEPLIMVAWLRAFADRLATDELGELADRFGGLRPVFFDRVLRDVGGASVWCDDTGTPERETCSALLQASLAAALADLEQRFGSDRSTWRWGPAHRAMHSHLPLGFVPVVSRLFSRTVPTAGGTFTVSRGSYRFGGTDPFANVHGGGYRAIYDGAAPERSRFMIATGQSGNPYSPHYDDLVADWGANRFFEMERDPAVLAEGAIGRLDLVPDRAPQAR
ncbi:MAG: penicillin acylase family protein [Alphaproteobacteria bacterium]